MRVGRQVQRIKGREKMEKDARDSAGADSIKDWTRQTL